MFLSTRDHQCIAPVAVAMRAGFLPFAPDVFRRCVRVGAAYFAAEDEVAALEQARSAEQSRADLFPRSLFFYARVCEGEGC